MTNIAQMVYGLIVSTTLLTTPEGFNVSTSRPFIDAQSLVECYEGVSERRAAQRSRTRFASNYVASVEYVTATYDPPYTNAVAGPFRMWNVSQWAQAFAYPWFWYIDHENNFYPFVDRAASHAVWAGAWWNIKHVVAGDNLDGGGGFALPPPVRAYTETNVTVWEWTNLLDVVGMPTNFLHDTIGTNFAGPPPTSMTISNLTGLRNACSNLTMTHAPAVTWLVGGRGSTFSGVVYRAGTTGVWYVAEMATGVVSVLDVSMVITQSIDTSSIPFVVAAEAIDLSFVAAGVTHDGPSTNMLLSGSVTVPTSGNKLYRVEERRDAVHRWTFTRCAP